MTRIDIAEINRKLATFEERERRRFVRPIPPELLCELERICEPDYRTRKLLKENGQLAKRAVRFERATIYLCLFAAVYFGAQLLRGVL